MANFEHFAVNWVEGMNINASHFTDSENFFLERLSKMVSISFDLYGILPNSMLSSSDIEIQPRGDNARITLKRYYGICPNGFPIFFDEKNQTDLHCTTERIQANSFQSSHYIVLSIAPYQRTPIGIPNPNEYPLRHPYTQPFLQLSLAEKEDEVLENPYCVIVGILTKRKDEYYSISEHYIPPSLSMDAHLLLRGYAQDYFKRLSTITELAKQIITKIISQPHPNAIAENVLTLCSELTKYLYANDFGTEPRILQSSPLRVYEQVRGLTGVLLSVLLCIHSKEKEILFKYFQEWNGFTPYTLEQQLQKFYTQKYEHHQLQNVMERIGEVLKHLEELLRVLSGLDIIGQHRESIVISETKS